MVDFTARRHIQDWLGRLAAVCPQKSEVADLAAKIDQYADLLASKLPASVFNPDSLEACSRKFRFYPSYGELYDRLVAYAKERPASQTPLLEVDDSIPAAERQAVRTFGKFRAEGFPHLADAHARVEDRMAVSLSFLRARFPGAFSYIIRSDAEAERIARLRGWVAVARTGIDERLQVDWGSITGDGVARKLIEIDRIPNRAQANGCLSMLRVALEKYAPHHLPLLPASMDRPPEERRQMSDPYAEVQDQLARLTPAAPAGKPPGALTPEQVVAMRAAAGITSLPAPAAAPPPEPEPPPKPRRRLPWDEAA